MGKEQVMAIEQRQRPVDMPVGVRDSTGAPAWGSDLVVDMLRRLEIEYAAVLPGSTFRGIHDSIVNYGANQQPEIILCNHEMITVALARGYARVTGRPMAAIVHNFVGLLNTTMTIYDAWVDRVPVLVLGGTGPVDAARRRPWIDWIHTANFQGSVVRDYTKWDDQPASLQAIPESLLRAYRMAITEPAGPVYVNFDVGLQEQPIHEPFHLPDPGRFRPAPPPEPDRAALRRAAALLVAAELPLCFADRVGRHAAAVRSLVDLAELLAMPVVDLAGNCLPTSHHLNFTGAEQDLLRGADVVLGLDVTDLGGATGISATALSGRGAGANGRSPRVIHVSLDELAHRGLTADYEMLPAVDIPLLASSAATLPLLVEECRRLLDEDAHARVERRRQSLQAPLAHLRAQQRQYIDSQWDHPQVTEARLVAEVWDAVKDEDHIFVYGRVNQMAPGVCQFSGPERYLGGSGGGGAIGAGPGVVVGSALALKGSGKTPVAILGDGEFLSGIQALWTAAHYGIPGLIVLKNNRSYYNDEDHQDRIARIRERPPENRWIGQRIENPTLDFAALARDFGCAGEGPIKDAREIGPAVRRALQAVKQGRLAVVDVWTANRERG
jgi:acetolactate synthase-1/2/3 large subunit